ncbi:MAG: phosphoenolpyruvate synthase [Gammaproteobacteria bacterium]|nr:phosphoenolpyruvate synthase [Gammaproteobacteria bacterium]
MAGPLIKKLNQISLKDFDDVGGKNSSLGEMISNLSKLGVNVPGGFAITSTAFNEFLSLSGLDQIISEELSNLDVENLTDLRRSGKKLRGLILKTPLPEVLISEIEKAWKDISTPGKSFAVRSSATAEDLPDASFAGQQESYLNIDGFENLIDAVRRVYASLFTDRAISYRKLREFKGTLSISVGVQEMVRSDIGSSGVAFTLDTESGYTGSIFITSSYGLGEGIVQGTVNPDEFYVYKNALENNKFPIIKKSLGEKAKKMIFTDSNMAGKSVKYVRVKAEDAKAFSLSDAEIIELAGYAKTIEDHYKVPMDIEWAKDGENGKIYILQARPETVQSKVSSYFEKFTLKDKGELIVCGKSVGQKIGKGTAKVVKDISEIHNIKPGDVLVTDMTDPDWEPVMKIAAGIVTNRGGRTCHAAIIARELGIPAIVGCNTATKFILNGSKVTVSCAEGSEGKVYKGELNYSVEKIELGAMPDVPIKIMMNVGNPDRAMSFSMIPNEGVGLARVEFIINKMVGIHPKALIDPSVVDGKTRKIIQNKISGYPDTKSFFIEKLSEGIATIAASFSPKPVIVRLSDFKSNEYANLIGGQCFEPLEENPMLGFRGASRYVSEDFKECFELECEALKRVRDKMGLTNVQIMIPFVRTIEEAENVINLLEQNGLKRGENGLKVLMMSEIPSNALLADDFLEHFDGMSIGSNDMTQLTLGLDRDSSLVSDIFDERDPSVKKMLSLTIKACKENGKYVGICGQGPSDHSDFAEWLLDEGIESISLNPDTVIETWLKLAKK